MACGGNRLSRLVVEESFKWAPNPNPNPNWRLVVEESFKWAMQRKVFGKRLADQPVIREKLAHMVAQVQSSLH